MIEPTKPSDQRPAGGRRFVTGLLLVASVLRVADQLSPAYTSVLFQNHSMEDSPNKR